MSEKPMFSFEDRTGELTQDDIDVTGKIADRIFEAFDELDATPEQALQALSALTSYVLAEFATSRAHANKGLELMCMSIVSTLTQAEEDCRVNWNQKSRH